MSQLVRQQPIGSMGLLSSPTWLVDLYGQLPSLKLTAKTNEHGWLEYDPASFWYSAYFSSAMSVSSG